MSQMRHCINSRMKWWNNGVINKRSGTSPGNEWVEGRLSFKRRPASTETKQKISRGRRGIKPWNAGQIDSISEETRRKMSKSAKARAARGILPDNTGSKPWNKGLSKEVDSRVKKYADRQYGQLRAGNYRAGEDHPHWSAHKKEFSRYGGLVRKLSESNYKKHKATINPQNFPRGRAGTEGSYQLDHKISVYNGFISNIPPEVIAAPENLQMLKWEENRAKGHK